MSQRFSLDVNSFQKLLAAAWVVQSQRDAGIDPKQTKELIRSNAELTSAIRQAARHNHPEKTVARPQAPQICIGVPSLTRRVPRAVPVYAQAHTAGSLALAEETVSVPVAEAMAAPALVVVEKPKTQTAVVTEEQEAEIAAEIERPVEAVKKLESPAMEARTDASAIREATAVPEAESDEPGEATEQRAGAFVRIWERLRQVQARMRFTWMRFAWRPGAGPIYAGSLAVLLITGNFLFSLRSQRSEWRQTEPPNSAPVESWRDQVTRNEVRPAPPQVDPPSDPPTLESSHLRVTDKGALVAVQDLSRFEIQELQRRAKYGDYMAALTLGMAYEIGKPVRQSCSEAARWIAMAAEEGSPAAQYNLALRYQQGDGTGVNLGESKKWMSRAASRGYEKAQGAAEILSNSHLVAANGQ